MSRSDSRKTVWLECATGISGDMTLAALIDTGVSEDKIQAAVSSLDLPDVRLRAERVMKGGFTATQIFVDHPEQHAHRHYSDILKLVNEAAGLSDRQKVLAIEIFRVVAESEAQVHGSTIEKVHFHEVGAIDSIVDIVGAAVGFDLLGADRVVCQPVPTGSGFVKIDHGICPVPAPGTAEILKGIPLAQIPVNAELTTPTGAAIVKVMADQFGPLPSMTIEEVGYGAGTMTFPDRANLLRIFVGVETLRPDQETVCLLESNIDDVSAEVLAYATQQVRDAGALDVFQTAILMKKNRSATMFSVLCRPDDADMLEQIVFRETATLGIRRSHLLRSVRSRKASSVSTVYGNVGGKMSRLQSGETVFAPEFEDCAKLAAEHGVALREIYRAAESVFFQTNQTEDRVSSNTDRLDHDHDHDHDR